MSNKKKRIITSEEELQQILNDAWLGIRVDEEKMFNPMLYVPAELEDDPQLYYAWLMSNPDYFALFLREIMNIQLLPFQLAIIRELWDRKFPMLIATRGGGKTFLMAI